MHPTSDIQFLAAMVLKARAGDQITMQDTRRLEDIAETGHSNELTDPQPEPSYRPHAVVDGRQV